MLRHALQTQNLIEPLHMAMQTNEKLVLLALTSFVAQLLPNALNFLNNLQKKSQRIAFGQMQI